VERNTEERKREVYMEESNIHKSCNHNTNSMWDLNNKQDVMTEMAKYKIHCYCFFVAMQGTNIKVFEFDLVRNLAKLVPGAA
jgi:hypothetical protein